MIYLVIHTRFPHNYRLFFCHQGLSRNPSTWNEFSIGELSILFLASESWWQKFQTVLLKFICYILKTIFLYEYSPNFFAERLNRKLFTFSERFDWRSIAYVPRIKFLWVQVLQKVVFIMIYFDFQTCFVITSKYFFIKVSIESFKLVEQYSIEKLLFSLLASECW